MDKKPPVDNSEFYSLSEHKLKDMVFNAVVRRYGKNGHKWEKSDQFIWHGAIFVVIDYFWMLVFVYFVYIAGSFIYNKYGLWRGVLFICVMFLIRINSMVRKLDATNRILKEKL